jgi:Cu(I)/Ag(I) efflux system membrane protein CusA/SilA
MAVAAILAVTLAPALMMVFVRMKRLELRPPWLLRAANAVVVGTIHSEEKHPISRVLHRFYTPAVNVVLRHPRWVVTIAVLLVLATIPAFRMLGSEFMPPLNEGSILYMPTTLPGISVTQAGALLQRQDQLLKQVPEVERVFGKAGRAESSTDPAPFSMMETVVVLKPKSEWRTRDRWYSDWPDFVKPVLRPLWPETITWDELVNEMNDRLTLPGQTNAWTMPIRNRIDMLTTGVRTPVGIKIFGSDLEKIEEIGAHLEGILQGVPGTRSVYGERTAGGYFVDFDLDREQISRYGLTIEDVQSVIMTAIGGENVTTTVEGRERYPINIRYPRELRDDLDELARTLVPTMGGAQVPLGQLARIQLVEGPAMIRNENGRLSGYVYVDVDTEKRDIGSYVEEAKKAVATELRLEPGYLLAWSGQYEAMARVREKMKVVLPVTLFVIVFLIYLNTKSLPKTAIVLLAVPFSAIGAIWLLWALGYNMSIGVWVGLIALLGVDAETGIFMLLYLDLAYDEARQRDKMRSLADLKEAVHHGAVQRVRPKVMTVATTFLALVPILWSTGTGADVMQRIAAPMIGGLFTSFLMELLVYPAIYLLWRRRHLPTEETAAAPAPPTRLRRWHWVSAAAGAAVAIAIVVASGFGDRATAPMYPQYEGVRRALVAASLPDVRQRAGQLAELAGGANREEIATAAKGVAAAGDLDQARRAFAALSEVLIAYRETATEEPKPVVAYCSMEKKSWLQPEGPISNPYVDEEMRSCGEVVN